MEVDFNRHNNDNTDRHFVAVRGYEGKGAQIMDPIDGKFKDGLPSQYLFKSYVVFEKNQTIQTEPSEWALEAIEKAKQKGIMDWDTPQEELSPEVCEAILFKLGLVEKIQGTMTKERFIVILDRAKLI
jgi:hypothetical protein